MEFKFHNLIYKFRHQYKFTCKIWLYGSVHKFRYFSHQQALKAQASLHICTGLPELSLPAYTNMDVDEDSDKTVHL